MFKAVQHLLPNGRAWRTTVVDKPLTDLLIGMSAWGGDVRTALDDVYDELSPTTTNSLSEWDDQFGLPALPSISTNRRSRLASAWRATGGQSPRYIQDTLRGAGFDVYVHDWWVPQAAPVIGSHACAVPRNPLLYLRRDNLPTYPSVDCGEPTAQCGEPTAQCGNSISPIGYPLVNKVEFSTPNIVTLCGEPTAACGEPDAECGNFVDYAVRDVRYTVPIDPTKWPFFWYVGGEVFGQQASVPAARRDEFEALCLKIGPTHMWIGVMVNYI